MTQNGGDLDLHARFQQLREEAGRSAPTFQVGRVASTRRVPKRWILAPVGTAVAAAALLWVAVSRDGSSWAPGLDMNVIAWTAPTDFLLDTPGSYLLSTVPLADVDASALPSAAADRGVADSSS